MVDIAIRAPGRSRSGLSLPLLAGLAVYAPLLFAPRALLGDPDTYWHIATGRWIIARGAVPYHDVFSFSMPGALLKSLVPVHALIATALAAALAIPHVLARPHVLMLPILVCWAAALVAARSEDRAPSLWLVPLITLWANLHSSYIFGLGL